MEIAKTIPRPPPNNARSALSVSNCATNLDRPAPNARRAAISFRRTTERAISRFATFAQAISRTSPTVAIPVAIKGVRWGLGVTSEEADSRKKLDLPFVSGNSRARRFEMTDSSAPAREMSMSGLSLPTTSTCDLFTSESSVSGIQTSILSSFVPMNSGGITPITVYGLKFNRTVFPNTPASEWKRRCQKP